MMQKLPVLGMLPCCVPAIYVHYTSAARLYKAPSMISVTGVTENGLNGVQVCSPVPVVQLQAVTGCRCAQSAQL